MGDDHSYDHVGVVLQRDGTFLLRTSPKPLTELMWELPGLSRRPGEPLDDIMRRASGELGFTQNLTSWGALGMIDDVSEDGFPRRSRIVLAHLPGSSIDLRPHSSVVWRSLVAGPPHLPDLDSLLQQALEADIDLLADAIAALARNIGADRAVMENGLEGRDPQWLRRHADAAADRATLSTTLGARMCFPPRIGIDDAGRRP